MLVYNYYMARLLRSNVLYPAAIAVAAVLGAIGICLYSHANVPALSDDTGTSLAEANDASEMCIPGQNNDVFFVTCGGIY